MNCRDIQPLLLAEGDSVLTTEQHASLDQHVAACPGCQQVRARLAKAMTAYAVDTANVSIPDIETEWQKLRAKLHEQPVAPAKKRPLTPVIWFGAPLAAAAALAFAYFTLRPQPIMPYADPIATIAETAAAEYVEAGDTNASTLVYVDKESGWLVVWATDGDAKGSG